MGTICRWRLGMRSAPVVLQEVDAPYEDCFRCRWDEEAMSLEQSYSILSLGSRTPCVNYVRTLYLCEVYRILKLKSHANNLQIVELHGILNWVARHDELSKCTCIFRCIQPRIPHVIKHHWILHYVAMLTNLRSNCDNWSCRPCNNFKCCSKPTWANLRLISSRMHQKDGLLYRCLWDQYNKTDWR